MLLTPIAPHTLTNRPVVIPATSVITVQPLADDGRQDVYVTLDGQAAFPLSRDDSRPGQARGHPAAPDQADDALVLPGAAAEAEMGRALNCAAPSHHGA